MDQSQLLAAVGALAAVAVVAIVLLAVTSRARRRTREELRRSTTAVEELRARVDELAGRLSGDVDGRAHADHRESASSEFVITTLPDLAAGGQASPTAEQHDGRDESALIAPVTAGRFASAALGESLVRIVTLGHGLRQALRPENRSRIRFAVRQESKRSRRERRRDLKAARRHLRAQQSGGDRTDLREDAA